MTYHVQIDRALCSGFGACVEHASGFFTLDGTSLAIARAETSDDAGVLQAARACPMGAITVVDAETGKRLS